LSKPFEEFIHGFDDHPKVLDTRNIGLMGAIEIAPREGAPGARGLEMHKRCFWEEDLMIRNGMDTIALSPFLNSKLSDWEQAFDVLKRLIDTID
jgi:beta-alanine--pyruvate transaminase